ncbi:uncharacterized protein BP5553_08962 [Venustampulla echinocandica]|uniref:Uncharacterized protein n=1 Tax=Venustampulla echinocandica TaxID=2656787 RepID=A0A370TDH5_9HELO|nr:uncharacterized protein BP5553_08962 [Venustampulla echinocandica]RDL32506.1 hypothetical protein BP5553_08962 [Venustampulla echinocandica]
MVQAGVGGLDTPRTNLGDATYLSNNQPEFDFDLSQEPTFQSPSKDNNIVQQLQNGRRGGINLKTPRSRVALSDRRNLPAGLSGGEFTPLLKSATRNSALRNGKENTIQTPAFLRAGGLDNIPEDLSALPALGSSVYGDSRNESYMVGTPMPHIDSSSAASTPMALLPRRKDGPGVLQDGNQLSLREQENVIDKIEKENFGLKLKIHFLEEALRKAGPGFSEAALKENTELKVDKVTLQKELHRYKRTLGSAERDVDLYRQQIIEMQEKVKQKHADEGHREELDRLRQALQEREAEVNQLKLQGGQFEELRDNIHDLEAENRDKNRIIEDREDEADNLKDELEKHVKLISDLKESVKQAQRHNIELEEKAQASEDLEDAKEAIEEMERDLRRLKDELEDAEEGKQEAMRERERAQADLEELQDEMANKSITTKGLSRQIEEKANRLQDDLEDLHEKHAGIEEEYARKSREVEELREATARLKQETEAREQRLQENLEISRRETQGMSQQRDDLLKQLEVAQKERQQNADEKNILKIRHDALTQESAGLQKELAKAHQETEDIQDKLEHEKTLSLNNEREVRDEYKAGINRLNDEIEDLRVEVREKERLYDNDSDKWESERRNLESQRDMAEEKAAALQRTINRLQEAEGTLSSKETKLQEALQSENDRHTSQETILNRQIQELNGDVEARCRTLEALRSELSNVREELRLSQRERKLLAEKIEGLEDEVEILQTSLDESDQANQELAAGKQETEGSAKLNSTVENMKTQLSKAKQEKQGLQDHLASLNIEMHSLRVSKSEVEAERDEIQCQLEAMKQQEEDTFRLDQERVDLRTTKLKLDCEVRRLREENKLTTAERETIEKDLKLEIERASAEEARLTAEINDLQKLLRGSSEKRELSSAKKTIQHLEERIQELERQIVSGDGQNDTAHEISVMRHELSAVRRKEFEFLQREATQKDVLRGLKRQITELERKAHETEISRLEHPSPHSSVSGSARKSEILEVRAQLAAAHQSLKDTRSQLKNYEKEASRKLNAANIDLQAHITSWESEKDGFERSLDDAQFQIDELSAKNTSLEATVSRLRGKIDRLEKALQAERLNSGEDRTMAVERRDLHEMLRETQIQAESLEVAVQEREGTIAAITTAESELRAHLKRVRDERALQRSRAASAKEQLEKMEGKFQAAQKSWDAEKKALCRGVRFVNTSMSTNDESEIGALKKDIEEKEKRHVKELRGMGLQIDWLRARCRREETFRASAAYAKRYMNLQIDMYQACNKADLRLLESTGLKSTRPKKEKNVTFRMVAWAVRATVRMTKGAEQWKESTKIHERLIAQAKKQRRQSSSRR